MENNWSMTEHVFLKSMSPDQFIAAKDLSSRANHCQVSDI